MKNKEMYTKEQMIEAAKYGYNYHQTTSFPNKSFDDNCKNNFLQKLESMEGICNTCNGTGLSKDGKGLSDTPYVCPKCNGAGV